MRDPLTDGQLAALHERYGEPQRAYHTWTHIEELIGLWRETRSNLAHPEAVLLAILFHDAIYDPRSSQNEEMSAQLLERELAATVTPACLAFAASLIRATSSHSLPTDLDVAGRNDAAHFLDMDLAILGASPVRFDAYEDQIRREYAHVSDADFAAGRAAILERFTQREALYFSEWGGARFEGPARDNLDRSLKKLQNR